MIIECKEIPNNFHQYFFKEIESINNTLKSNPFSELICYKKNSEIVGYLLYSIIYERMEIENIKVASRFRNQHIASNLLKKMIDIAKESKVINITLEVRVNNNAAIHLYEKFGFQKEAIRDNYYQNEDGLLMLKKIKETTQ